MLSPEQIKAREGKLTASRIAVLMNDNVEDIMQLYLELIGEALPENLDDVWPVQLGLATEQLNLDWFEKKNRVPVTRRGAVVTHSVFPWAACTLDGWVQEGFRGFPIECKHVGGREPFEVIIDRYQPQMQWQMEVMNADKCALSVIFGADEPRVEYVDRDREYAAEMIRRGEKFMAYVALRVPPVILPPVPAPIPIDQMREADMSADEVWCKNADIWKQCYGAAKSARDAEQVLKNKVEDDVRKAFGAGIRITRDKAGRLSLREDK